MAVTGRVIAGGLAAAAAALAVAGAARAAPVRVLWSTYLRAGPGDAFEAVSEVEHDTRVDLAGCDGRWCRVFDGAVSGYVDRDSLTLPRPPPPPNAPAPAPRAPAPPHR